jgi:NADH-quinone oxidoreductase subunit E
MAVCKRRIGAQNHRSADGKFYWQEVECMGACSNAPMAAINDYYYEDLTPESFEKLIDDFAAGKKPKPGSAIGRQGSAPEGGPIALTDPKLYDGSLARKIKIPNLPPKAPRSAKAPA